MTAEDAKPSFEQRWEAIFPSEGGQASPLPSNADATEGSSSCVSKEAPVSKDIPSASEIFGVQQPRHSAAEQQLGGRTDLAMKFMDMACGYHWYPCLVAKWPDGRCEVRTFDTAEEKNDREEWRRFIDERQGKANLFVLANDLKAPVTRLPTQADIGAVFSLVVRLSPNPHVATSPQAFQSERERLRELIRSVFWYTHWTELDGAKPQQVLDDGVSYWLRWQFATPVYLTNLDERYSDFDRSPDDDPRNLQNRTPVDAQKLENLANRIALFLGGDTITRDIEDLLSTEHCQSEQDLAFVEQLNKNRQQRNILMIDRYGPRAEVVEVLMPLPGTISLPTAPEETRYGRKSCLVSHVANQGDPSSDNTQAELEDAFRGTVFHFPGLPDPFYEIWSREARDRMRAACITDPELLTIWQGETTDRFDCRLGGEELTRRLVAKLKEHDFNEDDAKAVGFTFEYGNCELFYNEWHKKKSSNNWLEELNEKHFTSVEGGKPFVYTPRHDAVLHRQVLDRSTHHEFEQIYSGHQMRVSKAKTQSIGALWLKDRNHRHYPQGVAFMPNEDAPTGIYNLWTDWGYPRRKGDWSKMREHIRQNICIGNEEHFQYLLGWMAYAVQHPGDPGHVAIVMRGGRGVGKGKFATWFGKLFGQHWVHIANSKLLVGNFNAHLRDIVVVFADEAFFAGDKAHEGIIKALITEPTIMIEAKFQNAVTARNCVHLVMASNDDWVVPAGIDERRFFVVDVAPYHKQDSDYFAAIDRQMEAGGASAMLFDLLNMDLREFDVRKVPNTGALADQKLRSLDDVARWVYDILFAGTLTAFDANADWTKESVDADKDDLYARYGASASQSGAHRLKTKSEFAKQLKKILPGLVSHRPRTGSEAGSPRANIYTIPPLPECRAAFEKYIGSAVAWEDHAGD